MEHFRVGDIIRSRNNTWTRYVVSRLENGVVYVWPLNRSDGKPNRLVEFSCDPHMLHVLYHENPFLAYARHAVEDHDKGTI